MSAPEFCRIEDRWAMEGVALHIGLRSDQGRVHCGCREVASDHTYAPEQERFDRL